MSETLINKYRPSKFEDVLGHKAAIKAIKGALDKGLARTFLFTGGSGFGKTTLARIIANAVKCKPEDRLEIDAATNTGVEEMRGVIDGLAYKPIGGKVKVIIVDECHALSKNAWQALLKILEEPPSWVYWVLCTTEATKVPQTIKTRALQIDLKAVSNDDLTDFLDRINESEKLLASNVADDIVDLCVKEASGSPRQALANMALCASVSKVDEAKELLRTAQGSAEAFELARLLIRRQGWRDAQDLLRKLKDTNPEGIRHVVRAFMTTTILNAKDEKTAGNAMEILDAFSVPFHSQDGLSPVVLAVGKVLLS